MPDPRPVNYLHLKLYLTHHGVDFNTSNLKLYSWLLLLLVEVITRSLNSMEIPRDVTLNCVQGFC